MYSIPLGPELHVVWHYLSVVLGTLPGMAFNKYLWNKSPQLSSGWLFVTFQMEA